jgi:hypothetical protein
MDVGWARIKLCYGSARNMLWIRRFLITLPLAIAAVLNVLVIAADRLHLHREHIAGFGFLFATPWAWLLDHPSWFGNVHNRSLMALIGYALFLWIPAALYSGCLWLLFFGFGFRSSAGSTPEK